MRYAARKDENHVAVVTYVEAHGWAHERVSQKGFPDEVFLKDGWVIPVEIKSETGAMEDAQVKLHQRWERAGVRVPVVTSGVECVRALEQYCGRLPGVYRTYRDFPWEGVQEAERRKRLALTPARR